LVESESLLVSTALTFLAEQGLPMARSKYVARFMGLSASQWQREMRLEWTEALGREPAADCFDTLFRLTAQKMATELAPVAGARQAIATLSEDMCVASNSSAKGLHWKLARTGLLDLFDPHLYSSSLVSRGKPDPDLYLYAAAAHQCPPSSCIVIEDSTNGVLAAKRAGMQVIGFTGASHCLQGHTEALSAAGADRVINCFQDLATALLCLRNC